MQSDGVSALDSDSFFLPVWSGQIPSPSDPELPSLWNRENLVQAWQDGQEAKGYGVCTTCTRGCVETCFSPSSRKHFHLHNWITSLYSRNHHNTVNQTCFNKTLKKNARKLRMLWYMECLAKGDLLYSTGRSTQSDGLMGKESKKEWIVYTYDWITLLCSRNDHTMVNELYY